MYLKTFVVWRYCGIYVVASLLPVSADEAECSLRVRLRARCVTDTVPHIYGEPQMAIVTIQGL